MIPVQTVAQNITFGLPINAAESSWYAVQTLPRHEKAVGEHLQNENIDCLVPLTVRLRADDHRLRDRLQVSKK